MAEIDETDEAEEAMIADQLREFCTRLYGAGRWQTAMSLELPVNARTVPRWASGRPRIHHPVALCVQPLLFLDELRSLCEWRQGIHEDTPTESVRVGKACGLTCENWTA